MRKLWYLSDLARFCAEQQLYTYEANDEAQAIVVSIPAQYSAKTFDNSDDRFLNLHLKSCHTLTNRNHTEIPHDVMTEHMHTILNCPILADVQKYTDEDGSEYYDFAGHTMEPVEDPETGETRMNYIERIVGVVPADSKYYLKSEHNDTRQYLHVDGLIYEEHGNLTASILRKRKSVACSVEVAVSKMHYDLERKVLVIDAFKFIGITLLGKNVLPGMEGATAFTTFEETQLKYSNEALFEEIARISSRLEQLKASILEYTSSEKGGNGMNRLNELLQQYNITVEDITFDYESMTDEELENAFAEAFADSGSDEGSDDNDTDSGSEASETESAEDPSSEEPTEDSTETNPESTGEEEPAEETAPAVVVTDPDEPVHRPRSNFEINDEHRTISLNYEIEYDELLASIYRLLEAYRQDDDDYLWIAAHYIDTRRVVFSNREHRYRRVNYTLENNVAVSLDEPVEVFPRYLTADEDQAINTLRNDYNQLLVEVTRYREQEEAAQKDVLLKSKEYALIADSPEFKAVDVSKYSFNELRAELDKILLNAAKMQQFSLSSAVEVTTKPTVVNFTSVDGPRRNEGGFLDQLEKRSRGELK